MAKKQPALSASVASLAGAHQNQWRNGGKIGANENKRAASKKVMMRWRRWQHEKRHKRRWRRRRGDGARASANEMAKAYRQQQQRRNHQTKHGAWRHGGAYQRATSRHARRSRIKRQARRHEQRWRQRRERKRRHGVSANRASTRDDASRRASHGGDLSTSRQRLRERGVSGCLYRRVCAHHRIAQHQRLYTDASVTTWRVRLLARRQRGVYATSCA
jgi:hypothetical protein